MIDPAGFFDFHHRPPGFNPDDPGPAAQEDDVSQRAGRILPRTRGPHSRMDHRESSDERLGARDRIGIKQVSIGQQRSFRRPGPARKSGVSGLSPGQRRNNPGPPARSASARRSFSPGRPGQTTTRVRRTRRARPRPPRAMNRRGCFMIRPFRARAPVILFSL